MGAPRSITSWSFWGSSCKCLVGMPGVRRPRLYPLNRQQYLSSRRTTQLVLLQVGDSRRPYHSCEARAAPSSGRKLLHSVSAHPRRLKADLLSFSGGITRAREKKHHIAFDGPLNDILTKSFHIYCPQQRYTAQRNVVIGFVHTSNRCLMFDSRSECSKESHDRTWRCWLGFCAKAGR